MKKCKLQKQVLKAIIIGTLVLCLSLTSVLPAFAAQKISNPEQIGEGVIDGLDPNPDVGLHNSYAWCMELFEQNDGDYLWVGMNRDLGGTLLGASSSGGIMGMDLNEMLQIPAASCDNQGKIYRQKMGENGAEWEMVYENPAISGYRRMIVYKDDLYVCAGMTNRMSGYNYSVILRFDAGFELGDEPEIVLWDTITIASLEYFRSACVYNDLLYIGTFDSKVWVTDGENLTGLEPNTQGTGDKYTGWELALDLPQWDAFEQTASPDSYIAAPYVWDILGFNSKLYAFVTNSNGFNVYEMDTDAKGIVTDVTQTVGSNESAAYPAGMGIAKNAIASPFVSTQFDEEYMYVTTFANGPAFLMQLARGNVKAAFENIFCPAQIYRFDTEGNWQVVVGDTTGELTAADKNGDPVEYVGNQRAGFFLKDDIYTNVSGNQYVWWMAEYDEKLYASTWDTSVFKDYAALMMVNVFIQSAGIENIAGLTEAVKTEIGAIQESIEGILADMYQYKADFDTDGFTQDITAAIEAFIAEAETTGMTEELIRKFAQEFGAMLLAYAPEVDMGKVQAIQNSIVGLYNTAVTFGPSAADGIMDTLAAAIASGLYFMDQSNPAGFDLYVSEDGVTFDPVTVNGYGNKYNYGGRVLLPTEYGLYLATANPFHGGQVWRVNELEPSIIVNAPKSITLKVGQSITIPAQAIGLDPEEALEAWIDSDLVSVEIRLREDQEPAYIDDYVNYVYTKNNILNPFKGISYVDELWYNATYEAYMYDIVITGIAEGQTTSDLIVTGQDIASNMQTLDITVSMPETGILGDANTDGSVDITDCTLIQKYCADLEELSEYAQLLADANEDGTVDIKDVTVIQKYCADLPTGTNVGTEIIIPAS